VMESEARMWQKTWEEESSSRGEDFDGKASERPAHNDSKPRRDRNMRSNVDAIDAEIFSWEGIPDNSVRAGDFSAYVCFSRESLQYDRVFHRSVAQLVLTVVPKESPHGHNNDTWWWLWIMTAFVSDTRSWRKNPFLGSLAAPFVKS
jgi:hypothetical protein